MTTIRTTNVWETRVGGTTTYHYAVRRIACTSFFFFFFLLVDFNPVASRGPAPSGAASVPSIRPAQLPLSDPARAALLHRAPPHHLHPLLPRFQLAHRLRGARPRTGPRSKGGGGGARRGRRRRRRDEPRRRAAHRTAVVRLHTARKMVPHLLEAQTRARAPLLPVRTLYPQNGCVARSVPSCGIPHPRRLTLPFPALHVVRSPLSMDGWKMHCASSLQILENITRISERGD